MTRLSLRASRKVPVWQSICFALADFGALRPDARLVDVLREIAEKRKRVAS